MLFKRKPIIADHFSPGKIAMGRFRRNTPAMVGLLFILTLSVVAILGYLITPDSTPWSNDQKLELSIKDPGFTVKLLRVMKNETTSETGLITKMFYGAPLNYFTHPLNDYRFSSDKIIIDEYTGAATSVVSEFSYNIADVTYALEPGKPILFDSLRQEMTFYKEGKLAATIESIDVLRQRIVEGHIELKSFWLGSDLLGRDMLSRLIIGARISLSVGLVSVVISLLIGVLLGALAGYFGGIIDTAITWLINVVWSIPTLLLVIAITLVLGKGVLQVFIAVGLTMWVEAARIVRGQILGIREKEFVEAGRALGFSNARIIFKHILPNVMGPIIVIAAANFATAILMEAGLSFLGIGAQPPVPSWGEMTNAHRGYILLDKAWLAFIPGAAIMMLVLAFMMVGNGLRDALDSRSTDDMPELSVA